MASRPARGAPVALLAATLLAAAVLLTDLASAFTSCGPMSHVAAASAETAAASAESAAEALRQLRRPIVVQAQVVPPDSRGSLRAHALGAALGLAAVAVSVGAPTAWAADLDNGEQIFLGNCAACHAGGNNAVQPDKKLKKEALTQYGMYDVERIKYQVTNGKNAMPAFGERLSPTDIEDAATYVMSQADKGWQS
eukprot:CAMPEP_0180465048 /NCGR_PEP_ID=MMETSP1036_2-20121128/25757_1 /TAXON_ID=632150 /ORGANISM="Azadinium spinosum, Strain 3D9" /LENGTH=194 /DNA_ID=CAMNT_0022471915 /DNA_START=78 /DNA_END=662 /DNA_ORIENTATION=+